MLRRKGVPAFLILQGLQRLMLPGMLNQKPYCRLEGVCPPLDRGNKLCSLIPCSLSFPDSSLPCLPTYDPISGSSPLTRFLPAC